MSRSLMGAGNGDGSMEVFSGFSGWCLESWSAAKMMVFSSLLFSSFFWSYRVGMG